MEIAIQTYLEGIKKSCPNVAPEHLSHLAEGLTISELPAKQFYIQAGDLQTRIGYVYSGLIRAFYIDADGNEMTVNFIKAGDDATHYPALKNGTPSKFYFQSIEPSVVVDISYDYLIACCNRSHPLEHYLRLTMEDIFAAHLSRIEGFLFDNAEKRYLDFIKDKPALFNRISLSDLSSYLGIERQSLTRIRKKLLDK